MCPKKNTTLPQTVQCFAVAMEICRHDDVPSYCNAMVYYQDDIQLNFICIEIHYKWTNIIVTHDKLWVPYSA